ncbi:MAG: amidohydrolase family protein [Chloroflexi bacterium]|nr:amidohydrolase family protein [Chloroflexota bacterium]
MPTIDCHVHTWDWLGFTRGGEGPAYWDRCRAWAEQLDVTYVVSCPKPIGRRPGEEPDPGFLHAANQETFDFVRQMKGRAIGLCYVNPRYQESAFAEMEEWIGRRGFVGLKLLTGVHCNDPLLDPIVDWCAQRRVPICQHTWNKANGNGPNESTPMMLAELARRHPDATLVMYHTGGDFVYGAKAARGLDNVYCDIGGADAVDGVLEHLVEHVGADHVVFGSDLPGRSLTSQLSKVHGARLSDAQKEQILHGNMARILAARNP